MRPMPSHIAGVSELCMRCRTTSGPGFTCKCGSRPFELALRELTDRLRTSGAPAPDHDPGDEDINR